MRSTAILFDAEGHATTPGQISKTILDFGDPYNDATKEIIERSKVLDEHGSVFIECASRILSSFGMTRGGPFNEKGRERLLQCWEAVGPRLLTINNSVLESGLSRDRYLLELGQPEREELIAEVWLIFKLLLPFTMGKTTYGLVGASKILFSVLPEMVLPIDNAQWRQVFKTVDIGDVIRHMAFEIQHWESVTGRQLNHLDPSGRLTTLPSVYNVMAMRARPNNKMNQSAGS